MTTLDVYSIGLTTFALFGNFVISNPLGGLTIVEFVICHSIGWIGNCGICDLPLHWVDSHLWFFVGISTPFDRLAIWEFVICHSIG